MNRIVRKLAELQPNREVVPIGAILAPMLIGGLLIARSAVAQSDGRYDLSWWIVDGGGGSSEGGTYTLVGTAGQPDAGVMARGDYLLGGGFLPGGTPPERHRIFLALLVRSE